VLVLVERLLTRLRQPRSRADELDQLRVRLRAERAKPIDDQERRLAIAIRDRKLAVAAAVGEVSSCATCASGRPSPIGVHDGGACCAGVTADLFEDTELAALAHAGTGPADLTAPAGGDPHAGCTFRGRHGCSLALAHRPARCLRYVCNTLRTELHRQRRLAPIDAQLAALDHDMRRFAAVHRARLDREVLAPLVDALEATARRPAGAE